VVAAWNRENTPRVLPKSKRNRHWINVGSVPPCPLVTLAVKLTMMDAAQRHRELIRNPTAEGAGLRIPKMVRLTGFPAAQGARLRGKEAEMIFVPRAARL
jgi:hypothetical protein